MDDLILYEINVRNFSSEGTFNAILPRLNYLKSLGVDMIWFMPIHPIGAIRRKGSYGSPYSVQNFYETNADFGTKNDFRNLVGEMHKRGIRVIMDLVTNHTSWDHPWIKEHTSWYVLDDGGMVQAPNPEWTDVAQLNYRNEQLWEEMKRMMSYWVEDFDIDGYRCDQVDLMPFSFWKEAILRLKKIKPVFMLAESENPELYRAGFDAYYGFEMYHAMKKVWRSEASPQLLAEIHSREQKKFHHSFFPLRFITNHDEHSWQQIPSKMYGTEKGALAAFVCAISLNGLPLIFNGQESAFPENMNLFEKYSIPLNISGPQTEAYQKLLSAYHQNQIFRRGEIEWLQGTNEVLLFEKKNENQKLLLIFNLRNQRSVMDLPDDYAGKAAEDIVSGTSIPLKKNIELGAFEFYILRLA